ncbi:MAG: phosphomannomutase/phosphoglucomutase, partial [Candidatus Iainarchaeum archaeon]
MFVMLSKTIFREYDIRGIVDKEINEDAAFKIAKGFARLLNEKNVGSCIVGHDARIYSEKLKNSFVAGLLESGINVIDIGLCVTPMAYFAQHYFNVKGIAMITASHNPNGWTGFKLGYDFCSTLLPNDIKYLQSLVANEQFLAKNNGSYTSKDIVDVYVDDLAKRVKIER